MRISAQEILEKAIRGRSTTHLSPRVFRDSRRSEDERSVPSALQSASDHIREVEERFSKLADDYLPRGREDDIRAVVEALVEARREIDASRIVIEAIWSALMPWRRRQQED